ncbi:hypothetical protein [Streptomyces spiramenti]|uniref:Tox-PL domain-containing protein n=1 Tax=Streptomyces spiramenti TaxID=2720606 RepID=A0ABX1APB1_9ACTN|nr:hypothetical protein [Streptomyces spiramenti]NJP68140.1 hypothetical protein [Streptomyces spiramenti]
MRGPEAEMLAIQRLAGNQAATSSVAAARHQHGAGCGHDAPAVQRSTTGVTVQRSSRYPDDMDIDIVDAPYRPSYSSYGPPAISGSSPYGQAPSPYGQAPYGQAPSPYGQAPAPYGQAPYGQAPSPYGQAPSPFAPSPYAPSPYAPSPYDEDVDMEAGRHSSGAHVVTVGPRSSRDPRERRSGRSSRSSRSSREQYPVGRRGPSIPSIHGERPSGRAPAPSNVLPTLLSLGNSILADVQSRIPYTPNQISSASAAGGQAHLMLAATRNPDFRQPVSGLRERLGQDAAAAEAIGAGNCGENAAMSFCLLNRSPLPGGSSIWYVPLSTTDHVFVAVGPRDRPEQIVVIDPWQRNSRAVPATEFTHFQFLDRNGRINPDAQELAPDGKDYLQIGRGLLDMDSLNSTMDLTGPPVEESTYAGAAGMYEHVMPSAPSSSRPSGSSSRRRREDPARRRAAERWYRER